MERLQGDQHQWETHETPETAAVEVWRRERTEMGEQVRSGRVMTV